MRQAASQTRLTSVHDKFGQVTPCPRPLTVTTQQTRPTIARARDAAHAHVHIVSYSTHKPRHIEITRSRSPSRLFMLSRRDWRSCTTPAKPLDHTPKPVR